MATFEPQPQPSAPRPIPQARAYDPPSNANGYGNSYPPPPHGSYPSSRNTSFPPPPQAPPAHTQVSDLRAEHGYAPQPGIYGAPPPGTVPAAPSQTYPPSAPGPGVPHGSNLDQQSYQPPNPQVYPAQPPLHPQAPFQQPAPQNYVPQPQGDATRARDNSNSSTHSRSSNLSTSPRQRAYIPENSEPSSYPPGPGSRFGSTSPHRYGPPPVDASATVDPRYYDHYGGRSRGSRPVSGDFGAAWSAPMSRVTSHPEGRYYDDSRDYDDYDRRHRRRSSEDDHRRRRHERHKRHSEERRRRKSTADAIREDIEKKPTMGDSLMAALKTVKKAL